MPARIHIVGRKNSGKTTLIVDLVRHLTARGLRIGTIKHTHHEHELDTPGKDSHRHREAGAAVVGILSRNMDALFRPPRAEETRAARYTALMSQFADCDLVLVEGDSQTDAPKIEVWRAAVEAEPLSRHDPSIRAVVSDDIPEDVHIELLSRSRIDALADWLLEPSNRGQPDHGIQP